MNIFGKEKEEIVEYDTEAEEKAYTENNDLSYGTKSYIMELQEENERKRRFDIRSFMPYGKWITNQMDRKTYKVEHGCMDEKMYYLSRVFYSVLRRLDIIPKCVSCDEEYKQCKCSEKWLGEWAKPPIELELGGIIIDKHADNLPIDIIKFWRKFKIEEEVKA